jgi:hypothetical protein
MGGLEHTWREGAFQKPTRKKEINKSSTDQPTGKFPPLKTFPKSPEKEKKKTKNDEFLVCVYTRPAILYARGNKNPKSSPFPCHTFYLFIYFLFLL